MLIVCIFLKVRIWARKNAIKAGQGDYALSITQPILEFFEHYYNTSYPLSKSGIAILIFKFVLCLPLIFSLSNSHYYYYKRDR